TSQTQLDAYEALGVPEIWRYENKKLLINVLLDGKYVESEISPTFPKLPIIEAISQYCEQSQTVGTSQTLRLFRKWVKDQIQN
ncbi:Uma2 family endonuclease, partial [Microcoleus sp. HI-ES]|nr:Uma2 family endonuclease [Microcoleus sp. HI-ES]